MKKKLANAGGRTYRIRCILFEDSRREISLFRVDADIGGWGAVSLGRGWLLFGLVAILLEMFDHFLYGALGFIGI